MLVRKTCILFLFAALLGAGSLRAQQLSVEARIAGLESNEEYMSLLREDARALQMREDSIVNAVERARRPAREPGGPPAVFAGYSAARKPDIRNPQCQGPPDRPYQHHRAGVGARQPERRRVAAGGACRGKSCGGDSRFAQGAQSGQQPLFPGAASRRPTMPRSSKRSGWNSMPWIT